MHKDTFSGVLTFALLIGGTLAIGSAMLGLDQPDHRARTALTVASASTVRTAVVTLPVLTVTSHRSAVAVAAADSARQTVE